MIKKLKDILNTYSDEELNDMTLWINSCNMVTNILIDADGFELITGDAEIKINDAITKEANND